MKKWKKYSTCVYSVYTWICHHLFCPVHSIFRFSFFGQSDKKRKKSAVLLVYFLRKKITFCLKITADFFVFWSLWPKNEKWNELDIKSLENFITQGEFSQTINHFSRFCGMALNGFLLHSLVLFMSLLFCSSLFFTEFVLIFSK